MRLVFQEPVQEEKVETTHMCYTPLNNEVADPMKQ